MRKVDVMKSFTEEPPCRDFVLPGLPSNTLGALTGPGGVGKSFWALQAAAAVAGGKEADLLGISQGTTGRVVIFSAEDDQSEIHQRMYAICKHFDMDIRYAIAKNLDIYECEHTNIMNNKDFNEIKKVIDGARLVFFDAIRQFHFMDENSTKNIAVLINKLEELIEEANTTIVYLHNNALTDNVGWQAYMRGMTLSESMKLSDGTGKKPIGELRSYYVRFGIVSTSYFQQPLPECWLYRHEGGVLKPVTLYTLVRRFTDENSFKLWQNRA